MRWIIAFLLMLSCASAEDIIRFPDVAVTPVPFDPPKPVPITDLPEDQWLVVESDQPILTLASPEGLVSVDAEEGVEPGHPLRLRGRFVGGGGKVETRSFKGPCVYIFEAVGKGTVSLQLVPLPVTEMRQIDGAEIEVVIKPGAKTEADVLKRTLTVMGAGPQPPPDPIPPEPVKASKVTIAIVEDVMRRTPEAAILNNALVGWTALIEAGSDWRWYDVSTGEPKGKEAITTLELAGVAIPAITIRDKSSGSVVHKGPLPKTIGELRALVKQITGGP